MHTIAKLRAEVVATVVLLSCVAATGAARAQAVDLIGLGINAGFELPDQADGTGESGTTRDLGPGWTYNLVAGATSNYGVADPADGHFGPHPLPAPFEGRQIGFFNLDAFSVGEIISDPIGSILAGQNYALNVAVGARATDTWSDLRYAVGLRTVGGVDLGTFATMDLDPQGAVIPNIADLTYNLNVNSQAAAFAGQQVQIVLRGINLGTGIDPPGFTQANVDNVRLTGTLGGINPPLLTINRATGAVSLSKTGTTNLNITGYSLTSSSGSFDTANWTSISGNYDASSGGEVDGNDEWTILGESGTGTAFDLSEGEVSGGDGGILATGTPIALGNAWYKTPKEDVVAELSLVGGATVSVPVTYTGTAIPSGDLTGDANVTVLDWTAFKNGQGTDFTGLSDAQAYLKGDLDGDHDHDLSDFVAFRTAYEMFNGAGSFAALGVPEPATAVSLLVAGLIGCLACRRRSSGKLNKAALTILAIVVSALWGVDAANADLIARWSFEDGSGNDEISGLEGILRGNALIEADPETSRGMVLVLDDMSDGTVEGSTHVQIMDPTGLLDFGADNTVGHQGSATITAWVFNDGSTWTNHDPIFNQGEWRNGIGLNIKPDNNDHLWAGCEGPGCSANTSVNSDTGVPEDGTWNHVAATWAYDSNANTTLVTFYLNGQPLGYDPAGVPDGIMPGRVTSPVDNDEDGVGNSRIGLEWRDTTVSNIRWPFNGRIDDLRIYDEALDQIGIMDSMDELIPTNLTLRIDPVTGLTTVTNTTENPIMLNSYLFKSPGNHLNMAGWQSITADSDFPAGDGSGNGWEPGSSLSSGELVEWRLVGDDTVEIGEEISLGTAFNPSTAEGDRDLVFQYTTETGRVRSASIVYEEGACTLQGDFSCNGSVENADLTLLLNNWAQAVPPTPAGWTGVPQPTGPAIDNDELTALLNNWGQSLGGGSASAESVPEPSTEWLLLLSGGLLMGGLWTRRMQFRPTRAAARSVLAAAVAVAFVSGFSSLASAAYTVDRMYHFGDDPDEHGAAGMDVGCCVDASIGSTDTLDSMGPTGAFIDLSPNGLAGLPKYIDVSTTGPGLTQARPGAPSGNLGIIFDGVDDYLNGLRFNHPHNAPGTVLYNPVGPNNYNGVLTRGFQLWVYPNSAGNTTTQHIVRDTRQHGVITNSDGEWGLIYNNSTVDSNVAINFDQWSHVMVAMPATLPNREVLYVDGVAVAARESNYSTNGDPSGGENAYALTVGADTGNSVQTVGDSNYFNGVVDELEMFVWGSTYDAGTDMLTDLGQFNYATDNAFAAGVLTGVAGDVNQSGTFTQADIDDFVGGWLSENRVNGVRVGDRTSILNGDLNFDGITNLVDLGMLRNAITGAGSGAGFNLTALGGLAIPEPSALGLAMLAGSLAAGVARRRSSKVGRRANFSS